MKVVTRDWLRALLIGRDARADGLIEILLCTRIAFDHAVCINSGFAFVGGADERLPFRVRSRARGALRATGLIIYFRSRKVVELAQALDSAVDEVWIPLLLAQTRFEIRQLLNRGDRHSSRFVFLRDGAAIESACFVEIIISQIRECCRESKTDERLIGPILRTATK